MTVFYPNILLFGISGGEIMVIFLLILLLFGPKKIPEIARMLGRGINEFKKVQREINSEISRYSSEVENQARDMQSEIDTMLDKKKQIRESTVSQSDEPEIQPATSDEKPVDNNADQPEDDDLPYPYNRKTGEE